MKNMKKITSFILVAIMVMAMSMTALAAGHTIEIKKDATSGEVTNHEYTVYQLFTGDLAVVDGKNVLSNLKYGTAGLGNVGTDVPEDDINRINDADAYAQELLADEELTLTPYGTLKSGNNWKLTDVPSGYYLIVDDTEKTIATGDTFSKYIVQVVDDISMAPKSETVTSDKKEYNDAVDLTNVNEAGIGAVVSYVLTADIPANAADYDYYFFILGDKLSEGLTFNKDISVTINGTAAVEDIDYKVYLDEDGYTFEVALIDAKAHAGQQVVVKYSATVNEAAVTTDPETNKYEVIYSNKPYKDYNGKKDDKKPGKPTSITEDVFGKTPEKKTETYTAEIDLTKYANEIAFGNELEGAVFQLTSKDANQTVIETKTYYELDANGTFYLLKDGTYTTADPSADHYEAIGTGDEDTDTGYILVDGEYIVPTDKTEYAGKTIYQKVTGNSSQYTSTTNKYAQKKATTTSSVVAPVDMTFTTGANGVIKFEDLGTGTYVLHEVKAPEGYNLAADINIVITFDETTKKFKVNGTTELENGVYSVDVIDKSGSTLPETGGMGTTIFYVIGSLLVLGAGVILVTRRRVAR